MSKKTHIGILFGGRSCEHEVSVISTRSTVEAIDTEKYEITLIGISREGGWFTSPDTKKWLQADTVEGRGLLPVLLDYSGTGSLIAKGSLQVVSQPLDVIFPILHGPYGEDGTIQGLLELSDIPYVGAGIAGSAVGMDKEMMRRVFRAEGLPQVDYTVIPRRRWLNEPEDIRQKIEARFTYPLFIKPVNMGSSIGVSKVHNAEDFVQGMEKATSFDSRVMIEEEAAGCREVEVAVLGNENPQTASAIGEIVSCNEFYDYDAKYINDGTELIIPARISSETAKKIRKMALTAFQSVDSAGLSRIDFFISKKDESIYLNEINTMPGFTPVSMYPRLWEASGVPYQELIDRLIQLAIDRHSDRCNTRATR